ncbi:hypothetical protein LSAT2_033062 [Lamellibrachia satsuma]|nr:hypothetical protein LSAT2_033062 [Lamellibrachia satsuma]
MTPTVTTAFLGALVYCFFLAVTGRVFDLQQDQNAIIDDADKLMKELERGTCSCNKTLDICGCCVNINFPENNKEVTVCVELKYVPEEVGIAVVVTVDGWVVFVKTISARNPPPICFGVPHFEKEASVCLELYDLNISSSIFSGCARVLVRLDHMFAKKFNLGCFKLPVNDINEIKHKD